MTTEQYKSGVKGNYDSKEWKLLEKVAGRMIEKGIFIDTIEGTGKVKDSHEGKQVGITTVYRHNATCENVSIKIKVDELKEGKYIKHIELKITAGASEKVIDKRIDKILEVLNG